MADSTAPVKTPLPAPAPESVPPPAASLTDDQQAKYAALLEQTLAITDVTCNPKAGAGAGASAGDKSGPLTDAERAWLTRECLLRYLRATKWNAGVALERLLATLAWRREYGIDGFTPDYISPEQETGKQIILGFDRVGRPCQYLNPGRQNTDSSPRQIHHMFYMVERVIEIMPAGVETLSLMINFKPSKTRSNTSVPLSTSREVLSILQNHYPERLGKALIINVPWVVQGFFKLMMPFIDPVTREKLKFNEDMKQYVPPEQLWSSDWGGDLNFDYDHETYWPALVEMCTRKREAKRARWEAAGSLIGESEAYLAGGTDVSVSGYKFGSEGNAEGKAEDDGSTVLDEKMAAANLEDGVAAAAAAAAAEGPAA